MSRAGPAVRAHPLTVPTVTLAVTLLAFALPGPFGPAALYAAVIVAALASGVARAILPGALVCLPLWFFLFVLHALWGEGPTVMVGPVGLSRAGSALALAQGARLGAIVTATLVLYHSFQPARFLDAVAERRWPFAPAYLFVATLQAMPRLVDRARTVREAQRARGLRVRGSLGRRWRALRLLVFPLVVGALAEIEERTLALETRAAQHRGPRTPLDPPRDRLGDRLIRWGSVAVALAAIVWRVAR